MKRSLLGLWLFWLGCGGLSGGVAPEWVPPADGPGGTGGEDPGSEKPSGDTGTPGTCAGTPGVYPLTGPEGSVPRMLTDACQVYWLGSGHSSGGDAVRTVPKAGGTARTLATLSSTGAGLGLDADHVYTSQHGGAAGHTLVRVPKTGGALQPLLSGLGPIAELHVAGGWLYFLEAGTTDLARRLGTLDLATLTEGPSVPLPYLPAHLASDGASLFVGRIGATNEVLRFALPLDPAAPAIPVLTVPGTLHGLAATPGHLFAATGAGLYVVAQGALGPPPDDVPCFSVSALGATAVVTRGWELELARYENGALARLAKSGQLGGASSAGVALDTSGVYWSRQFFIERHDQTPEP